MYGIKPDKDYDYIFWRSEYPIDLFTLQVENNLLKKYNEYSGHNNGSKFKVDNKGMLIPHQPFSIFQIFKFKKQVSTRVVLKGFEQILIGTIWQFGFNVNVNRQLISFALDIGLGERNSLGFGFMNLVY